jgi:hypothetical protein
MILPTSDQVTVRAKAIGASIGSSKNGSLQVAVTCQLLSSELAGETITYIGTVSEKAVEYLVAALDAFGWTGDDPMDFKDVSPARAQELLPNEVELVLENETYDGKTRARVKFVNSASRVTKLKFTNPGEERAMVAQAKSLITQFRGGAKRVSISKPVLTDDSDLPF